MFFIFFNCQVLFFSSMKLKMLIGFHHSIPACEFNCKNMPSQSDFLCHLQERRVSTVALYFAPFRIFALACLAVKKTEEEQKNPPTLQLIVISGNISVMLLVNHFAKQSRPLLGKWVFEMTSLPLAERRMDMPFFYLLRLQKNPQKQHTWITICVACAMSCSIVSLCWCHHLKKKKNLHFEKIGYNEVTIITTSG